MDKYQKNANTMETKRTQLLFCAALLVVSTYAQISGPAYNTIPGNNVGIGGTWAGAKLYVVSNPPNNGNPTIGTWTEAGASQNIGNITGLAARAYSLGGTCGTGIAGDFDLFTQGNGSLSNGIGVRSTLPATAGIVNGTGISTQVLAGSNSATGIAMLVSAPALNKYGMKSKVNGSGLASRGAELWALGASTNYGAWCEVSATGTTGYGVYGIASGMTSFQAGVYGAALQTANATINQQNGTWNNNSSWAVYSNGPQFSTTHALWGTSDERLKNDIRPLKGALQAILGLEPKVYTYRRDLHPTFNLPPGEQMGLISQEVQKILPSLVMDTYYPNQYSKEGELIDSGFELKVMNYNGLIPLLVAAVKEHNGMLVEKDKELEILRERIEALENVVRIESSKENTSPSYQRAYLHQNAPNPFTATTLIRYELPSGTRNARIDLSDGKGQLIRSFDQLESKDGKLLLEAGSLNSGVYYYSLIADGEAVDTRMLMITR
ncbi:MAG: tail fiber domain-containing protein [Flavobacteriales bacterium]|nr:tail fiber domain-containing protein [Flavobacteriales bacterium]